MNHPSCWVQKKKRGIEFISSCQAIFPSEVKYHNHFLVCAKSSAIPAWLNESGMSWERGASPCPTGTHLLMAAAASQGEILVSGALGWEAPEICRSSTPGDSPTDYLEGVGKASSDCTAVPRAVLSSATCLPYGLGPVTSSLFLLPLCPSWVRCVGREITLLLHIGQTLLLAKRALSPLSCPQLGPCFPQQLASAWTGRRTALLWARSVEFCLSLFWQEELLSLSPIKYPPSTTRQSLDCVVHHHLGTETFLTFLWLVFRLTGGEATGKEGG